MRSYIKLLSASDHFWDSISENLHIKTFSTKYIIFLKKNIFYPPSASALLRNRKKNIKKALLIW